MRKSLLELPLFLERETFGDRFGSISDTTASPEQEATMKLKRTSMFISMEVPDKLPLTSARHPKRSAINSCRPLAHKACRRRDPYPSGLFWKPP
jgi:hypothetical protein